MREVDHSRAAAALLQARRTRQWLQALPEPARPGTLGDAYAIQDLVARELGPVAGWKVGAASADSEPFRAPIHAATLFKFTEVLPAEMFHVIGVEAEIAYQFFHDMPPRDEPYTREEVTNAVDCIHLAFEIVDTRFSAWGSADPLSHTADQQNHGALVAGHAVQNWRAIDPLHQRVILSVDGATRADNIGGNSAGDPIRLLHWMANLGARSLGGLRAGHIVTTGSHTGTIFIEKGAQIRADFPSLGSLALSIA